MKKAGLLILIICMIQVSIAQKQIQIKNQNFEILAAQNGKAVTKSTKQFAISLNYETGQFTSSIDMANIKLFQDEVLTDKQKEADYFNIEGVFPVNDILDNKNNNQQYKVELNIINRGHTVPTIFNLDIKNYTNARTGFRQFIGSTTIDLRDFIEDDLYGYEPEIRFVITFEAYIIGQR